MSLTYIFIYSLFATSVRYFTNIKMKMKIKIYLLDKSRKQNNTKIGKVNNKSCSINYNDENNNYYLLNNSKII